MMQNFLSKSSLHEKDNSCPLSFHPSFYGTYQKLQQWQTRFPIVQNETLFHHLTLLMTMAPQKFLNHRTEAHLCRLVLSICFVQRSLAAAPPLRHHCELRWVPAQLHFPFAKKSVLGCLIGLKLDGRHELFDEESVLLILQKKYPDIAVVGDSTYTHLCYDQSFKMLYVELEGRSHGLLPLEMRNKLKTSFERHIGLGIQKVTPAIFMRRNEEEVYKTILSLSREICSPQDVPQVWISLEGQEQNDAVFLIILVSVGHAVSSQLEASTFGQCTFIPERSVTVRYLDQLPVSASIFRLYLKLSIDLVRSDGSLDFYVCRRQISNLLQDAIGEFRDYNGGGLSKQWELLEKLEKRYPSCQHGDRELREVFFYSINPLEQQSLLSIDILAHLFKDYLRFREEATDRPCSSYLFETNETEQGCFLAMFSPHACKADLLIELNKASSHALRPTYALLEMPEGLYFHCTLPRGPETDHFWAKLKLWLKEQSDHLRKRQIVRIATECPVVSWDPRIGGDGESGTILRLLFEGLTRFDEHGHLANGLAESIEISQDRKHYFFKLRPALWNDGSPVTAYDFEHAWTTVLRPDFKTAFAHFFYPIVGAKEAKEGHAPLDKVGIQALDERSLWVELSHPTPYFLELIAQHYYFPVHKEIDLKEPQWPYQTGHRYPCNGPFMLMANDQHQDIRKLIKNPRYWNAPTVQLDEILLSRRNLYEMIKDFQHKTVDWLGAPFGPWHPCYEQIADSVTLSMPSTRSYWLVFNTRRSPFNNCKVRQSLAHALDRAHLLNDNHSLIPARSFVRSDELISQGRLPEYNKSLARELLMEGLEELGLKRQELPPFVFTVSKGAFPEAIAEAIASQVYEVLGIPCQVDCLPWNAVMAKMGQGDVGLTILSWIYYVKDPAYTLNMFRHSHEQIYLPRWQHPLFQSCLDMANSAPNEQERIEFLRRSEDILYQELPVIPLFDHVLKALVNSDLSESAYRLFASEKTIIPRD